MRVRFFALAVGVFLVCTASIGQQKQGPNWDAWKVLQGKWVGEGQNEQAQGSGYFTFEPDLQNKVWMRKNHAEYPGKDGNAIHDDLMIVYFDGITGKTRAFYCDTEGHVIHYTAEFSTDGKKLVFLGDRNEGVPQFRLTYIFDMPGHMSLTLEMSPPSSPNEWRQVVKGKVRKVSVANY